MRIALLTTEPGNLAREFAAVYADELKKHGIDIELIIVDTQDYKKRHLLRHAYNVAKRQARIAECSVFTSFLRILTWKFVNKLTSTSDQQRRVEVISKHQIIEVPSLNSSKAISVITERHVDIICLMGTRMLTPKTLHKLNAHVINVHSSDPAFVRGGPVVVWEVLSGKSDITLTIHYVTPELDAGDILMQLCHPIVYKQGLGLTLQKTMELAQAKVLVLFKEVLLGLRYNTLNPRKTEKGPLRVTPSVTQTIRAEIICRNRARQKA